jgi:hypothetical protein
MFHEEIIIDGVLNWRSSPDGEFKPYTAQELTSRIKFAQEQLRTVKAVLDAVYL